MNLQKTQTNRGFVILFAVTISAILLAIALGVMNIALREVKFGTSAKDTNEAFFAADTGAECALYADTPDVNAFSEESKGFKCADSEIILRPGNSIGPSSSWSFIVPRLGSTNQSCASVVVSKDSNTTSIVSKGYNNGGDADGECRQLPNTVEREIDLIY